MFAVKLLGTCFLAFSGWCAGVKLFSLTRCGQLFDCLTIGLEAMMAVVALFFFMICVGTGLMLIIGTGG